MVQQGEADLAIHMLDVIPAGVDFRPLARCANYLVLPRGHPLTRKRGLSMEDVARWPLVAPVDMCSHWRTIHRAFARARAKPHVVMKVDPMVARLRYVEAGVAVTIASAAEVPREWTKDLIWIPMTSELPATTLGLITRKDRFLSPPAKRLTDFLAQALPAMFAGTRPDSGAA
jgi:DNA-binding transcriptional LysR family regulator